MRDCRGKLYQWVQEGFPEGRQDLPKGHGRTGQGHTLLTSPTEPAGEGGNILQIMTRFSPT